MQRPSLGETLERISPTNLIGNELMRESKPLEDKTKFTKVRNCFVQDNRVFFFIGDSLQIIDYDNVSEEQS